MLLVTLFAPPTELSAAAALGALYYFALAHQPDFDVRWSKGPIGELIFSPLVKKLEALGVNILGGRRVVKLLSNQQQASVSNVVAGFDKGVGGTFFQLDEMQDVYKGCSGSVIEFDLYHAEPLLPLSDDELIHRLLHTTATSIQNVFIAGDCVKQGPGSHGCKGLSQEKAYVSGLQAGNLAAACVGLLPAAQVIPVEPDEAHISAAKDMIRLQRQAEQILAAAGPSAWFAPAAAAADRKGETSQRQSGQQQLRRPQGRQAASALGAEDQSPEMLEKTEELWQLLREEVAEQAGKILFLRADSYVKLQGAGTVCKQRLCHEHIRADAVQRVGYPDNQLWRYCFQCGKLELLSSFDGDKRHLLDHLLADLAATAMPSGAAELPQHVPAGQQLAGARVMPVPGPPAAAVDYGSREVMGSIAQLELQCAQLSMMLQGLQSMQ
eukprot:gene5158-5396_t